MKIILYKYIVKEMVPNFMAGLIVFGLIMMATRMMSLMEWVINKGVQPRQALSLICFSLPNIILFALPAVALIGVLITFLRLSSDNEIVALKSSGISLYQLLPPVFALSFLSCLFALFIALYGMPWGNNSFKETVLKIIEEKVDVGIKERIFCEPFDDVIFYINSITKNSRIMQDVFVFDQRDNALKNTIIAKEARILKHPDSKMLRIHFKAGEIFIAEKKTDVARHVKFKTYDLNIDLEDMMPSQHSKEKSPEEMDLQELYGHIRNPQKSDPEYYNKIGINLVEKFTIPIAVFFMGLIGAPLGVQIRSKTRTFGIFIGLIVFLFYYLFLAGVRSLCETGTLSPFTGSWIPDLFLLITCIYFIESVANERPIPLLAKINWINRISKYAEGPFRNIFLNRDKLQSAEEKHLTGEAMIQGEEIASNRSEKTGETSIHEEAEFYIGNIRMRKFHRHDCRWAMKITPNNMIKFRTRQEALYMNHKPCEICKP